MPSAIRLADRAAVALDCVPNGSGAERRRPERGDLLIWNDEGDFAGTGHVAVVVEVCDSFVRIAEQNNEDVYWHDGRAYSRELAVTIDAGTGAYTIREHQAGSVRGWMHVTDKVVVEAEVAVAIA